MHYECISVDYTNSVNRYYNEQEMHNTTLKHLMTALLVLVMKKQIDEYVIGCLAIVTAATPSGEWSNRIMILWWMKNEAII